MNIGHVLGLLASSLGGYTEGKTARKTEVYTEAKRVQDLATGAQNLELGKSQLEQNKYNQALSKMKVVADLRQQGNQDAAFSQYQQFLVSFPELGLPVLTKEAFSPNLSMEDWTKLVNMKVAPQVRGLVYQAVAGTYGAKVANQLPNLQGEQPPVPVRKPVPQLNSTPFGQNPERITAQPSVSGTPAPLQAATSVVQTGVPEPPSLSHAPIETSAESNQVDIQNFGMKQDATRTDLAVKENTRAETRLSMDQESHELNKKKFSIDLAESVYQRVRDYVGQYGEVMDETAMDQLQADLSAGYGIPISGKMIATAVKMARTKGKFDTTKQKELYSWERELNFQYALKEMKVQADYQRQARIHAASLSGGGEASGDTGKALSPTMMRGVMNAMTSAFKALNDGFTLDPKTNEPIPLTKTAKIAYTRILNEGAIQLGREIGVPSNIGMAIARAVDMPEEVSRDARGNPIAVRTVAGTKTMDNDPTKAMILLYSTGMKFDKAENIATIYRKDTTNWSPDLYAKVGQVYDTNKQDMELTLRALDKQIPRPKPSSSPKKYTAPPDKLTKDIGKATGAVRKALKLPPKFKKYHNYPKSVPGLELPSTMFSPPKK